MELGEILEYILLFNIDKVKVLNKGSKLTVYKKEHEVNSFDIVNFYIERDLRDMLKRIKGLEVI